MRGTPCDRAFAAPRGTPFDRKQVAHDGVTTVLTLLGQGGPLQALVAASGFDARTVATG